MLYYLPIEPYIERYTYYMSCVDGWAETNFKKYNVKFVRVDGDKLGDTIKDGVVLDACGRSYYAMSQIMKIVRLINAEKITDDDVIYVEDFWHPGIESLFYIRQLKNMKFKIGTFIHAQSVDNTDFAWAMKDWMRPIEQGYGKQYDYIFTCSHLLQQLCIVGGIAREDNIFHVGLPYNSTRLIEQLKADGWKKQEKDGSVIFASRFDDEKDPMFFLDLVEACPNVKFKLVNPRKNRPITSNMKVLTRLTEIVKKPESNLTIIDTFDKVTYYTELSKASVLINCANQDWVSWTLLEAITFGAYPLYPIWKDFEYELKGNPKYLYEKRNLKDCQSKLFALLREHYNGVNYEIVKDLDYVVAKHNNSWHSYLKIMGVL